MPDCADSAPCVGVPGRTTRAAARKAAGVSLAPAPSLAAAPASYSPAATTTSDTSMPSQVTVSEAPLQPQTPSTSLGTQASSWRPQLPPASVPASAGPLLHNSTTPAQQWAPGLLPHQTPHPVSGCAWGTPLALPQAMGMGAGLRPPTHPMSSHPFMGFPRGPLGAPGVPDPAPWSTGGVPTLHHAGRCVMPAAARQACSSSFMVRPALVTASVLASKCQCACRLCMVPPPGAQCSGFTRAVDLICHMHAHDVFLHHSHPPFINTGTEMAVSVRAVGNPLSFLHLVPACVEDSTGTADAAAAPNMQC